MKLEKIIEKTIIPGHFALFAYAINPYYIPVGLIAGHLYDRLCEYLEKNGYINFTGNFGKP